MVESHLIKDLANIAYDYYYDDDIESYHPSDLKSKHMPSEIRNRLLKKLSSILSVPLSELSVKDLAEYNIAQKSPSPFATAIRKKNMTLIKYYKSRPRHTGDSPESISRALFDVRDDRIRKYVLSTLPQLIKYFLYFALEQDSLITIKYILDNYTLTRDLRMNFFFDAVLSKKTKIIQYLVNRFKDILDQGDLDEALEITMENKDEDTETVLRDAGAKDEDDYRYIHSRIAGQREYRKYEDELKKAARDYENDLFEKELMGYYDPDSPRYSEEDTEDDEPEKAGAEDNLDYEEESLDQDMSTYYSAE